MIRNYTKNFGKGARCKEEMRETLRKEFGIKENQATEQFSAWWSCGLFEHKETEKKKLGRIRKQDVE